MVYANINISFLLISTNKPTFTSANFSNLQSSCVAAGGNESNDDYEELFW